MLFDFFNHFFYIVQDFVIGEPKNTVVELLKYLCPFLVVGLLLRCLMIFAIDFDNEHFIKTHKVNDEILNDVLPTEFDSKSLSFQTFP